MGLNVASVKSYVSSALTTTLFGSGVGEREVGKLTSIIMNKMLFAQGWQFSVEVDGLEGADFFAKDITYHDYSIEYERHCCKVSDEAAFCLIQRPYISKTLLTRRISPRGSP
ncbi:hypothetical protein [Escherichia coli]